MKNPPEKNQKNAKVESQKFYDYYHVTSFHTIANFFIIIIFFCIFMLVREL